MRAACVLLALLASACSGSDEAAVRPTPTSPTAPAPSPPPVSGVRLQMSGRVLDQNGTPVPGASVAVDYPAAGGVSNPPSHCPLSPEYCWLATKTNDRGEYAVEFESLPNSRYGVGYVYSHGAGYESDVQWVPNGSSAVVRDMRLRSTRRIRAGESIVVTVNGTSSLCTDLEDLWVLTSRCEIVVVESEAGMLNVEARPTAGGTTPSVFWYTTGNYAGAITPSAPGSAVIPARGGTYRILVGLPEGAPSQQFTVTTSLR